MVEDKYIGLALALSSSLAIGTSFIITKKGLNDAVKNSEYANASDDHSYLKNPIWWAGMSTIANFAAYLFAPPILVTPLGALSVLIGAVLASLLLKEELGHVGRVGCTLCLIGSLIIVLHAPADKEVQTVDEILHYAVQPGFLLYVLTVLIFTLVVIYAVAPKYGRKNPLVYISVCSLVGSVSVMSIKGFGVALKLTFSGNNQFTHPSTYVFAIIVVVCIMVQMNYFNKALDSFSTNVVNPMYYVGFSTATLVASLILFQGLNTTDGITTVSLLSGFAITFLGVHLLNLSRIPEPPRGHDSILENGLLNPRLSISGRLSMDGWNGTASGNIGGYRPDGAPHSAGFGRHSSLYRHQTSTLYSAFEEDGELEEPGREAVGLRRLREEPEETDDDFSDADERTRLRSVEKTVQNGHLQNTRKEGSRSHSSSPRLSPRAGGS
ncbi:DUF803-domain-containing protein [Fomitiporia mediterranea MF3/22]|uniref:DUF803-domain-containing protein n=1 Tax=Fomitiporia mediterranea (strain MF3/22) TaxID=694068 RepID=UPI0004407F2F|nr:DUF803-domain-containing protein [Fomitiporia mediterranea MF3/22]EJD05516.1 DUF803-domain-containing protein [Fomitiporia mediterranea MF3/22]